MTESQALQSEAALARLCEAALEGLEDLAAGRVLDGVALDDALKLPCIGEAGTGSAPEDEKKALREIVAKMNDLFSGHITESDFVGSLTAWAGHLEQNEKLAAQARNNSVEQFEMGDFKDTFTDIVIEAQDAHNQIAEQLLKDQRIFGVIQKMVAKMVWQKFQPSGPAV